MLDMLRVKARLSLNPAQNKNDRSHQVMALQLEQERLWEDYNWPHLRVERIVAVQAGQKIYDTPEDIRIDRLEMIEFFDDGRWWPVKSGIDAPQYAAWESLRDERAWPPRRWKITEDEDVELWPIPDTNGDLDTLEGCLKFTGIRNLKPFVDADDRAELDDKMIVGYVAADVLAGKGAKDASKVKSDADAIYTRLRGRMEPRKTFQMFGVGEPAPRSGIVVSRYRPAGT